MDNLKSVLRGVITTLNPGYALSPLLLKTVSVDQLKSESDPVIYQESQTIDCPEFMDMPVPPNMVHVQSPTHTSPVADFRVLNNLVYYAESESKNLLLTEDRKLIIESSSTMRHPSSFRWRNARRRVDKTYTELCMVFRGVSNNYYHTIIDNIPRMMALHHAEAKKLGRVKLLVPGKCTNVESELLSRVLPDNVDIEIIEPGKTYKLERCLFSKFSTQQFSGYVPSSVLAWLHQHVCPDRPRTRDRMIYITRSLAPQRRLLNEKEVIKCVKNLGFEVYALENLGFMDQVELFYDAKCVVGLHGAGFTNIIFSEGINVVEIFPYRYVKPSYYLMTKAISGAYNYVTGKGDQINIDVSMPLDKIESVLTSALNGNSHNNNSTN